MWMRRECWCHFVRACRTRPSWCRRDSQVRDQITPRNAQDRLFRKGLACLICDQLEAAFFFMRVLLLYRHVLVIFLFCSIFLTRDWNTYKQFRFVYVCVCVQWSAKQSEEQYLNWWLQFLSKGVTWWEIIWANGENPSDNSGKQRAKYDSLIYFVFDNAFEDILKKRRRLRCYPEKHNIQCVYKLS